MQKSGRAFTIALPKNWARALNVKPGDEVEVLYNLVVLIAKKGYVDWQNLKREIEILQKIQEETERGAEKTAPQGKP